MKLLRLGLALIGADRLLAVSGTQAHQQQQQLHPLDASGCTLRTSRPNKFYECDAHYSKGS
jgi:hypothetical protein